MHSSWFFRVKPIARLIFKREIFAKPYNFLPIHILLSTTVLNDGIDKAACEATNHPMEAKMVTLRTYVQKIDLIHI